MNGTPDFESLLDLLLKNQIEFLVCGGVAVALNGFVRTTEDLDILVSAESRNIRNLLSTLKQFGQGHAALLSAEDFALEPGCVRLLEGDCPLDIFTLMGGLTYEQLLPDSVTTSVAGGRLQVRHLNRQRLWALKKDSRREKDRIDAAEMLRLDKSR